MDRLENTSGTLDSGSSEVFGLFNVEVERRGGVRYGLDVFDCFVERAVLTGFSSSPLLSCLRACAACICAYTFTFIPLLWPACRWAPCLVVLFSSFPCTRLHRALPFSATHSRFYDPIYCDPCPCFSPCMPPLISFLHISTPFPDLPRPSFSSALPCHAPLPCPVSPSFPPSPSLTFHAVSSPRRSPHGLGCPCLPVAPRNPG